MWKHRIPAQVWPLSLTGARLALAPVVLALVPRQPAGRVWVLILSAASLSDVIDGIVARRLGVATAGLRRFDSAADAGFYMAITWAAWRLHPEALRSHAWGIAALFALEISRHAVDLSKFGRETAYHMWSAKAWGMALFLGLALLLGSGQGSGISVVIIVGIYCDLEGLAASLVLPTWTHDVPSILHAWRLRQGTLAGYENQRADRDFRQRSTATADQIASTRPNGQAPWRNP
ncbi:MAG: CDP-alcohol phosphatidyltransferase family protein [Vicinamibacteria bacterium]